MNSPTPIPAPGDDPNAPIANFSNCHVGIVAHLDSLGELPALLAPAERARRIAADTLAFFDAVIVEHHAQEEQELFPAVLAGAVRGEERAQVAVLVERLTTEHRQIDAWWARIKPQLHKERVLDRRGRRGVAGLGLWRLRATARRGGHQC